MERLDLRDAIVDLGDATELTRGPSPVGDDDGNGTLRKGIGITDED